MFAKRSCHINSQRARRSFNRARPLANAVWLCCIMKDMDVAQETHHQVGLERKARRSIASRYAQRPSIACITVFVRRSVVPQNHGKAAHALVPYHADLDALLWVASCRPPRPGRWS